ncbi:MAG: polysaccharide biosynthesis C-terminal domain-containing protein [Bacteroidia bacterium]
MSVFKKLLSQTAIYGLSSILGRVLNTLLTPLYTKAFAEGEYGWVSDLYSWTTFVLVVLTFGMETTFFKFMRDTNQPEKIYHQGISFVGGLTLLFTALCLMFAPQITHLLGYETYPNLIYWGLIVIALDALSALPMAKLRADEKPKHFAIINLMNIALLMGLNTYFVLVLKKGIEYVFIANIIASGIKLVMALALNFPKQITFDIKLLRPMLKYGFFIMIAGFAGMMNENLDKILIARLWEDGSLFHGVARTGRDLQGLYSAGYKLGIFIALVTQAFRYAAEPFFFKHSTEKDSPKTFAKIFHYFVLACLGCFLLISAFRLEIVSVKILGFTFLNQRYWESLEIVPIILMAYVFSAAYTQLSVWYKLSGQTHFALYFTGIGAAITIIINVLTIADYGYIGSAWATLICYVVMSILAYYFGQKYYPVPYQIKKLSLYFLAITACFFLTEQCGNMTLTAVLLKLGICFGMLVGIYIIERRKIA